MAAIAWLGTGLLGAGFVEALARREGSLAVWNRTIEKARRLERFGARVVDDPREAVRGATEVHLILKDDETVDDMLARIEDALEKNAVVVDHTTVAPSPTKE